MMARILAFNAYGQSPGRAPPSAPGAEPDALDVCAIEACLDCQCLPSFIRLDLGLCLLPVRFSQPCSADEARQILAGAEQRQSAQLGIGRDEYEEILCLGHRKLTNRWQGRISRR